MFTVYILYSPSFKKTYVGFTNNIVRRMEEHNYTESKGFTLRYRPWTLIYTEDFEIKQAAMNREKYFKTGVGRQEVKLYVNSFLSK
jgi:putative endonuclease